MKYGKYLYSYLWIKWANIALFFSKYLLFTNDSIERNESNKSKERMWRWVGWETREIIHSSYKREREKGTNLVVYLTWKKKQLKSHRCKRWYFYEFLSFITYNVDESITSISMETHGPAYIIIAIIKNVNSIIIIVWWAARKCSFVSFYHS